MKNILHKYTGRTLKKNKVRTAVTLIGIILSMGLMTAVLEGAYSGIQYLINIEIDHCGNWHGGMRNMTEEKLTELAETKGIDRTVSWEEVGWADAKTKNEDKPYLLIESLGEGAEDLIAVRLIEGRLPENDQEILLPEHLKNNGGVNWKTGDKITLDVGRRVLKEGSSEGAELSDRELGVDRSFTSKEEETIADTVQKTYIVTGTYMRFYMGIEPFECPGYTALTRGKGNGNLTAFYTLKNPRAYYEFANNQSISSNLITHTDLLVNYGITGRGNVNMVIYGFAAILILLIVFGSVSLIYNSFSISVSERTRQFGILKSVGATGKQIRSSVFYEAFVLSGIAIPIGALIGCGGIGLVLYLLQNSFDRLLTTTTATKIHLVIWVPMLVIAAAICLLTTLISAWVPAFRAKKISPIEAIRQSRDVKIKNRSVKTSKLTEKLFGFEGMMASKNFKREKKRYRSVVISLFLSILLFIATSSLTAYLQQSVTGAVSGHSAAYDVTWSLAEMPEGKDPEQIISDIKAFNSVDEAAFVSAAALQAPRVSNRILSENLLDSDMVDQNTGEDSSTVVLLNFVDDAAFEKMLEKQQLDRDAFFNKNEPQAVVYHHVVFDSLDPKSGNMMVRTGNLFKNNAAGQTISCYRERKKKGMSFAQFETKETGEVEAVYYELKDPEAEDDGYAEIDPEKEQRFPADEVSDVIPLKIGALIDTERDYFSDSGYVVFQYPYSMMDAVLKDAEAVRETLAGGHSVFVLATDHKAAAEDLHRYEEQTQAGGYIQDAAEEAELIRLVIMVVNVFSFGFIIVISLIAAANVFNTISTNVNLRRREFAMLKSVGLSDRGFRKMMNYECIIYGCKGLIWGLPASVVVTFLIWKVTTQAFVVPFSIPWYSFAIAVGAVFLVVFASMLYAARRVRKDNMIEAIKNENL